MIAARIKVNDEHKEDRWLTMMSLSICFHVAVFSTVLFVPHSKIPFSLTDDTVYHVELVGPPPQSKGSVKGLGASPKARVKKGSPALLRRKKTRRIGLKRTPPVLAKRVTPKHTPKDREEDLSASTLVDRALSRLERKREEEKVDSIDKTISRIETKVKEQKEDQPEKTSHESSGDVRASFAGERAMIPGLPSIVGKGIQLYQMEIEDAIKGNWSYPVALFNAKTTRAPETKIIVTVRNDGKILKTWFAKRSENSLFDESVLKAIERSDPLPRFPSGYRKSYEEVEINFSLKDLLR